jgi:hypothetical protein
MAPESKTPADQDPVQASGASHARGAAALIEDEDEDDDEDEYDLRWLRPGFRLDQTEMPKVGDVFID